MTLGEHAEHVAAIVLAAGEGRRLGGAKPLVRLGGLSLLERVLALLRASRVGEIVVVTGFRHEQVAAIAGGARTRVAHNEAWREGMTTSIQAGIHALSPEAGAFLVHPVDHVLVTSEDIDALVRAWRGSAGHGRLIARPRCAEAWGHPVLFSRAYASDFLALSPTEPGHTVYRRHRSHVLPVDVSNPHVAFDLDTPSDLERARLILGLGTDPA